MRFAAVRTSRSLSKVFLGVTTPIPCLQRTGTKTRPAYTAIGATVATMATKPVIHFATGNQKKLEEVVAILSSGSPLPCTITSIKID